MDMWVLTRPQQFCPDDSRLFDRDREAKGTKKDGHGV